MAAVQSLRLRDGRTLCVRSWPGSGNEPLVLLHGLLDSSEGWSRLCECLSGVAFDLPGFGHSDPPARGSIAGYARDVAEGLEMLGVNRMALVGHSLGGAVAAALAELLADRVTALVLFAPAGFGRIHLAEAVSLRGVRELAELALPVLLSSRFAVTAAYVTLVSNGTSLEPDLVERVKGRGRCLVDGVREATRSLTARAGRPMPSTAVACVTTVRSARCGVIETVWCPCLTATVCARRSRTHGSTFGKGWDITRCARGPTI
jgi:pimeloyl-ACP methyl ester carboxylesterase